MMQRTLKLYTECRRYLELVRFVCKSNNKPHRMRNKVEDGMIATVSNATSCVLFYLLLLLLPLLISRHHFSVVVVVMIILIYSV